MSKQFGDAFSESFNPNFQNTYNSFLQLLIKKKLQEEQDAKASEWLGQLQPLITNTSVTENSPYVSPARQNFGQVPQMDLSGRLPQAQSQPPPFLSGVTSRTTMNPSAYADPRVLQMLAGAPEGVDAKTIREGITPDYQIFGSTEAGYQGFNKTSPDSPVKRFTEPMSKSLKKNIDRVVGRDGYYWDVVEFPDGSTDYVRSNVLAPEKMIVGGNGQPAYSFIPTSEGIVAGNRRTGEIESNTGLGKPLTGEMIVQETQLSGLKDSFNKVKQLYKPNYVGAVMGRVAGLQEVTTGLPKEQAQFNADLADIQNTLIYLKSGKQINEQEYERLLKQLPDKNLPQSTFEARITEFERILNDIEETRRAKMGGYGSQSPQKPKSKFQILKVE